MIHGIKFKTASNTEYILKDVETVIEATGELCPSVGPQGLPVRLSYTGNLARIGTPLRDLGGGNFETNEEFHSVEFSRMPEVGSRFTYYHSLWAGCYSTPVSEISEMVP